MAAILLAEDDAAARGLMARALAADGHAVTEAEDGQAALKAMTDGAATFDVLVTDVDMPGLDGIALAEKAMDLHPALKVLLISGLAGGLERANVLTGRGVRTLAKPASIDNLRREIRSLIG